MLIPVASAAFKRDYKRAGKRGKDLTRLRNLIEQLIAEVPLPPRYRDHPLKGNWAGWRDAHIEPDWLLIYRVSINELQLARTGSHADLFNE